MIKLDRLPVLRTLYKRIGYAIIPKPHFSSHDCINFRCRCFDVLLFAVLAQSVAAIIAAVAAQVVAAHVVADDRSTVTGVTPLFDGRSLVHSTYSCARLGLRDRFWMFFAYKKILGRSETRIRDRICCQSIRTV